MAATVSGVLHTVVVLHVSTSAGGSGFDVVAVGDGSVPSLPLVLLGSLWAGGESGLSSVFVVHRVLSWLGRPGFLDYAIGGGLAAAVLAAAGSALGWSGPDDGWAAELAAGALAGTVYRVFAGASRHD